VYRELGWKTSGAETSTCQDRKITLSRRITGNKVSKYRQKEFGHTVINF